MADREIAGCAFKDARLGHRFRMLLKRLGSAMGESIPLVCQDWANTKAAYRFFANERGTEEDILAGHFQSTRDRFAAAGGSILTLHDTTEFSYQRENLALIRSTKKINSRRDKAGRLRSHIVCGILMHSSIAVTTEGLPLGLAAIKFWARKKFKGTSALKKKSNPTRVPIEKKGSIRCLENLTQSTGRVLTKDRSLPIRLIANHAVGRIHSPL
jgi:Transposase DNA-binding